PLVLFAAPLLMLSLAAADAGTVEAELEERFAEDPAAAALAKRLYVQGGYVVSTLPGEEEFEGGYRGVIHVVPQLPVASERRDLEWAAAALQSQAELCAGIEKTAGVAPRYRWRGLELRFFKSVKRRTPAAFALGSTVSYNVNGTLNGSERQVRDLLFHEVF